MSTVDPPRPLGDTGQKLWDEIHSQGDVRGSMEQLMLLCEQFDERSGLRLRVLSQHRPSDRTGLRALDQQIADGLDRIGLRTILPVAAVVVADDWTVKLAERTG